MRSSLETLDVARQTMNLSRKQIIRFDTLFNAEKTVHFTQWNKSKYLQKGISREILKSVKNLMPFQKYNTNPGRLPSAEISPEIENNLL